MESYWSVVNRQTKDNEAYFTTQMEVACVQGVPNTHSFVAEGDGSACEKTVIVFAYTV